MSHSNSHSQYKVILAVIAVVIIFIYFSNSTGQEKTLTEITNQLQKEIPSGSFLREIEKIPNLSPSGYVAIYVENPKIATPLPNIMAYTSCPAETMGQSITGIYHLILYRNGKIVNDVTLPQDPWGEPSASGEISLSYKNTKSNNHTYFNGPTPVSGEEDTLEQTNLINFNSYTGEGNQHEFLIIGVQGACGYVNRLVAGYDDTKNQVVIYPVIIDNKKDLWVDRFTPDSNGVVDNISQCGDHGDTMQRTILYKFDQASREYKLLSRETKPCP